MVIICWAPQVCLWYMVMSLHLSKFGIFRGFCFYGYECIMIDFVTTNSREGLSITSVTLGKFMKEYNNKD